MKHQILVADPPWGFNDGLTKMKNQVRRSAISQYKTMTPAEVAALPVHEIIDSEHCLLALWVPGVLLEDGLMVMHSWGFNLKQVFVWVKLKKKFAQETDLNFATRFGMGRLFRQAHELALICTSGKESIYPLLKDHSQRSVAFDLNLGHSCKPATLQKRLDKMFPTTQKVELFARRQIQGWNCLGNGIDGKDICVAIHDLAMV